MSKIPVEKYGKSRPLDISRIYTNEPSKIRNSYCLIKRNESSDLKSNNAGRGKDEMKEKLFLKSYTSFIPKMNFNTEKVVEQNPRILDLREKLNEISRKQDNNVNKVTKDLLNDITHQLDEAKDSEDSGPYSLLFDLQTHSTSSKCDSSSETWEFKSNEPGLASQYLHRTSNSSISMERLPNVVHFDDKPLNEFEYSCEKELNYPSKPLLSTQTRSDLCLQLKSHTHCRNYETNLSPNDNSLSRANEESSLDDSLGILTPDQMDDICYLENAFSPTVEGLPIFCETNEFKASPDNSDTPTTDKTDSNSAASTIQNDVFECVSKKCKTTKEATPPMATFDSIDVPGNDNDNDEFSAQSNPFSPCNVFDKTFSSMVAKPSDISIKIDTEIDKEESVSNLGEEDFLPSTHESILEPASSLADTTVNLEIPLDCKHINPINNRIEQTPSPEDLPLDCSDIHGEISTYSQFSGSTLHDSQQTYTDSKNDKSIDTSKVSNSFITSITSITSLDGYQGDGEMSRPVSRNADHNLGPREDTIEMDWQNVPVTRRADPMTDSDFFTESDADGIDDHMHRGDRKAQVIDGALYGGKNSNPPLIVNRSEDSCMESSGVYTDLENHRASPVFLHVINDMSPDSTTSTRSDCSQKGTGLGKSCFTPLEDTLEEHHSDISHILDEDETPKNTSKRNSLNSVKDLKCNDKGKDEKRSFTLKKYKMPKRDVPSKLKAMLANRKPDADNSVQSSPKTVKKTERRDRDFLKKNALDVKTKSFKDIKSKVDCSFSLQRSQTSCSVSRLLSSKSTNTNSKPKSRHLRMRMDTGSAVGSGKSSLHSSQSDISAVSSPAGKHGAARYPLLRNGKKRESAPPSAPSRPLTSTPQQAPPPPKKNGVVQKLTSSPVAVRSRASLAPPPSPRKPVPHKLPAQRPNSLATSKEPPRVTAAVGPRGKRAQTPHQARSPPAPQVVPVVPQVPSTAQQATLAAPQATSASKDVAALSHASKGVEALGVLVQYLVFQLDALNSGTWRAEAERWRGVAAVERASAARAERERTQRAQKDLDTIAECLSKISELEMHAAAKEEAEARMRADHVDEAAAWANDVKQLKSTIESLKEEVAESRARLHACGEIERTLRAQLEAARAERATDMLSRAERASDTASRAELASDSLRAERAMDTLTQVEIDTPPASPRRSRHTSDAACDPVCYELESELRLNPKDEELSTDATELAAEVRSLRAVVEMKQSELASLRGARAEVTAERARRAAAERSAGAARQAAEELRERAAARQRDMDRLRDENRRLRDVAARDRDHAARLAALNEELRYKLRQKSQVVSLLAGGGYMDRTPLRARTCSESRSPSPLPDTPPSPVASPDPDDPPLPAVKGVVEKHDSVSWVLEIEETPEEMASRLARRSSFRSGSSQGAGGGATGGVKRRGGGSPGSSPAPASPAPAASKLFRPGDLEFPPAPPPLKESAGEAIYIYDDRHY